jgi:hypothetical protein
MKKIFFYFLLSVLCLKAAAINEAELRLFAQTQVDDTFDAMHKDIKAYLQRKGFDRLPEGHPSLLLAPMPGEKGPLDETVTLLRFSPMQNAAIAEAQLRLVRGFLVSYLVNGLKAINTSRKTIIDGVTQENESLLRLIIVLTAQLNELTQTLGQSTTAQQELSTTIENMNNQLTTIQRILSAAANA